MNGINSLIGHSIFEELRNDHLAIHTGEPANIFYATVNRHQLGDEELSLHTESIKYLDFHRKPRAFKKYVQECNVFVIDLLSSGVDLAEVEYAVKVIKSLPESIQQEKIVLVISTVMTWYLTPPKIVEVEIESDEEKE